MYHLTLRIHYETKFGEYLCVTGDIEELGKWEQYICKLKNKYIYLVLFVINFVNISGFINNKKSK